MVISHLAYQDFLFYFKSSNLIQMFWNFFTSYERIYLLHSNFHCIYQPQVLLVGVQEKQIFLYFPITNNNKIKILVTRFKGKRYSYFCINLLSKIKRYCPPRGPTSSSCFFCPLGKKKGVYYAVLARLSLFFVFTSNLGNFQQ